MAQQTPQQGPSPRADVSSQSEEDLLPAGALISYQRISRGIGTLGNYRWVLYEDGRWYHQRNSDDYYGQRGPFESDLPSAPTRTLPSSVVREVEQQLRGGGFPEPPPRDDSVILDGVRITIVARLDGKVDQLTDYGASSPMLDYLSRFAARYSPTTRR